ncbi:DUF4215 domain-containing protein [Candidatus Uhrbacteria bacterium]|nr:DUF4215 domain-containing protein [Candidatus Uhrbacteria bacterium]
MKRKIISLLIGSITGIASMLALIVVFSFVAAQQNTQNANSAPTIVKAWPASGGKGQYVTLDGSGFGYAVGEVLFTKSGQSVPADVDFSGECKKLYWRDSYVAVKVPRGISEGSYTVAVKTADGTVSNTTPFIVTGAAPNPGICGMEPDNGPPGLALTVYGIGFGNEKGRLVAGSVDIPIGENEWSANKITALMPSLEATPTKLRVITSFRTISNPINLTSASRCAAQNCGAGQQCCSDGSCRPDGQCGQEVVACRYAWNFFTGEKNDIGGQCEVNDQCSSNRCEGGVCVRGTGGLDAFCEFDAQCRTGLVCELGACSLSGKDIGQACTGNSACASGTCKDGVCVAGNKSIGDDCRNDRECSTNNCVGGTCGQSKRCVSVESIIPKPTERVYRNSVFRVKFNQLLKEDSVRPNIRIEPAVPGDLEIATVGSGDSAKTEVAYRPSQPLASRVAYRVVLGDSIQSVSGNGSLGVCTLTVSDTCSTRGVTCKKEGDICSNGARCIGGTAICSGKGTVCTGAGSKCLDGATCTGTGSTCIGTGTQCTNSGSQCRDRAECAGINSRCDGLGTRCLGDGSECKSGAACVGKPPKRTVQPSVCDKAKQTCTTVGSQCSNTAQCKAIDSSCSGAGTVCEGNGSSCVKGATCTGSKSQCSDPGTTCTGSESRCSNGARCTGIDSSCSGIATQCTGGGSNCTAGSTCSGPKSTCTGSSTTCNGVASKCEEGSACPNAKKNPNAKDGCSEGLVKCGDGQCRSPLDPSCKPSSCNTNGICDSSESCNCADCFGKQSSCQTGFACNADTKSCQAKVVISVLPTDNARCSATVPAEVTIGQVFSAQLRLENTGTANWSSADYVLSSQQPPYTSLWGRTSVVLPSSINAKTSSSVSTQVTAPAAAGTYAFAWQMRNKDTWFGERCVKNIRVISPRNGGSCNSNGRCEANESCTCSDCSTRPECQSVNPNPPTCGNGKVDYGEQCDDGDKDNENACRNDCTGKPGFCGNGMKEGAEQCDDGDKDDKNGCSNVCSSNANQCGNGKKEGTEQCDDGNAVNDDTCHNNCSINTNRPICTDGIRDLYEQCDDGNTISTDACRNDCTGNAGFCRNGTLEAGEECDDGDTNDANACSNSCKANPEGCGNKIINAGEQCDDGNKDDTDACRNDCTIKGGPSPQCGDGIKQGTEQCDDKNQINTDACRNDCASNPTGCGNGIKNDGEQCDDGDTIDTNACRNDCRLNTPGGPVCRDGVREDPEQCDDGNSTHTDACRNDCTGNPGFCGNGIKDGTEQCDDGDTNDANACRNSCTPRSGFCGNGLKEGNEQCDDGDRLNTNECLNDCTLNRTGPRCGNSVVEGSEQCDDGNAVNTDACRNDCTGNAGYCGNGAKEGTEQCDDGDPDNSNACKNDCTGNAGFCGNGAKEGTEQCDDGDRIDGNLCKNNCTLRDAALPYCGNGKVEAAEQCDDGDTDNSNACKNDCSGSSKTPVCGNGAKEGTEQCDDGDRINTNACANDCKPNTGFCGNGIQETGEQCDDGDRIDADLCRNNCTLRVVSAHNARCTINAPQTIRIAPGEFDSGHSFTARIRLENTGTNTWNATGTPSYRIRSQSPLDNTFWSKSVIAIPVSKPKIAPGEFLEITTSLIAPVVTGVKPLHWQLMEGDTPIGEMCMASVNLAPQFTNDALCTIRTSQPFCGDGLREGDEQCDDGDRIDANLCRNDCTLRDTALPYCGNGKQEAGEECDGSDTPNNGRCRSDCVLDAGYCGNGILDAGEQCDDGNRVTNDGCTNTCTRPTSTCGNGVRDRTEQCDDGNTNNDDACSNSCRANAGTCGNGVIEAGEQCDDGDRVTINACTNACNTNLGGSWCGNGNVDPQIGEECDDGNLDNTDACTSACKLNTGYCGNGIKEGTEQCDDGDRIDANLCRNDCTLRDTALPYCGNGKLETGEQCDDGNRSNTDRCRTDCRLNKGVCGNGIKEGSEECDDGDTDDTNACTNACRAQNLPLITDEHKDFLLEFSLKNAGTKTWNPATHIFALRSSGTVRVPELDVVPLSRSIAPGERVTFGVRPYTPLAQGRVNLILQMKEGNSWFGEQCKKSVWIQKSAGPVTPVAEIAEIATVEIFINTALNASTTDLFTCAALTGCSGDQDTVRSGNQHTYRIKAYSAEGSEVSPVKIEWFASGPTATSTALVDLSSLSTPTIQVTPKNQNGTSTVTVKATGSKNETVQQNVRVTIQLENINDEEQDVVEPTPVTRAISAIRLSTNGDYLPSDAFGCIGNSCADDASSAMPGNQHRIVADFFDANGKALSVPDERISWALSGATSTVVLSRDSGKTIFATNTADQGSATLTVSVSGSSVTKAIPIVNKFPRRECLTANRAGCIGGPDQAGRADEIAEAAIEANDRPLGTDVFTCFGNNCLNDRVAGTSGNQRVYSLRLHNKNRSFADPTNIAKIEWSLIHASSSRKAFRDLDPSRNNPEGTKDFDIILTNTEVDGSATLSATVTPVTGKGNPITASIQVINQVQTFLVRDILIKSNGQFLNQDAFGCTGNSCEDDRAAGSAGNQHALELVVTDGRRVLSIDQAKVHWSLDRKDLFDLSSEQGTSRVNVSALINDAATSTGSGIITARVDGISAIASIALDNKHPYQRCTGTGTDRQCVGHPDKQGNVNILDTITIDSNGRPISRDVFSCRGDSCEDDREQARAANQHTYDARMHAQNNRLLPLDQIRRIEWTLSASNAFGPRPLRVMGTKGERVVIENTDKPGSATLTVTVLPVQGPVRTTEIVLVNDTELADRIREEDDDDDNDGEQDVVEPTPVTRAISAIRLSTNGDYLPSDAFGCIGNSCADDASSAMPGNQHRIVADFLGTYGECGCHAFVRDRP